MGKTSTIKLVIELPIIIGIIDPLFNTFLVLLFTTTTFGGEVYPDPPEIIVTMPTIFESFNLILGDTKACGLKVISEEYVKFSLINLVSLIFPIVLEFKETNKFSPSTVSTPESNGNFLYSDPPDIILTLFTGPEDDVEVVVYSKLSHSEEIYSNFSGTSCREI